MHTSGLWGPQRPADSAFLYRIWNKSSFYFTQIPTMPWTGMPEKPFRDTVRCVSALMSIYGRSELQQHALMRQSCGPNDFISLSVRLDRCDVLKEKVSDADVASFQRRPYCILVVAKSQAVSWAHLHMARTSRVKPMSLGFSSPRISRCFIIAMNSLLLSSPFPEGGGMIK